MNTRKLKKELKYKIPQLKLALIRERHVDSFPIQTPSDVHEFAEPLKYHADYVPQLNMCRRCRQGRLWLPKLVCCGT